MFEKDQISKNFKIQITNPFFLTFFSIPLRREAKEYGNFNFFFLIGNTRTIINEKKKRQVQVVHDDEQQETNKTNNKTKEREIRKII